MGTGTEKIWLGLNDRATEGTWKWSDGTHIDESKFVYTHWSDNEPNDHSTGEDCVELLPSASDFKWNDKKCNSLRPFVCETVCAGPSTHRCRIIIILSFDLTYISSCIK